MEKILLRPEQGAEAIGVSRATLYKLMASGELKSITIGRSRRILVDELRRWVQEKAGLGDPAIGAR